MTFEHVLAIGLLQLLLQLLPIMAIVATVMAGWLVFSTSEQAIPLWLAGCTLLNLMFVHWLVPPSVQYLGSLDQYGIGQYIALAATGALWLVLVTYFIDQLQQRFTTTQRR